MSLKPNQSNWNSKSKKCKRLTNENTKQIDVIGAKRGKTFVTKSRLVLAADYVSLDGALCKPKWPGERD